MRPASASTVLNSGVAASKANDNDSSTGWSPTGTDTSAWWPVDLGQAHQLGQYSLTMRQDIDQPETRSNFEIRDSATLPMASTLTGNIDVRQKFRYVRVAKTDGAYFFFVRHRRRRERRPVAEQQRRQPAVEHRATSGWR